VQADGLVVVTLERVKTQEAAGIRVQITGVGVDQACFIVREPIHLMAGVAQRVVAGAGVVDLVAPDVVVVTGGDAAIGFGEDRALPRGAWERDKIKADSSVTMTNGAVTRRRPPQHRQQPRRKCHPPVRGGPQELAVQRLDSRSQSQCNLYSLIETAKANGLEPLAYPNTVFARLPQADSLEAIERLLPWNQKQE
jgi:hypothetical protein